MARRSAWFTAGAGALAMLAVSAPALAGTANRAWVSGHGTDASGCGAPTAPCRSFQYVHDNIVAAGGEIDVLDGAGYGAVTITKALSIVAAGAIAAVQQPTSGQNGITINVGASDAVHLRGLTLEGLGIANDGIIFNSGASLDVVGCVVRHFVNAGINDLSSTAGSRMSISDTLASDNGNGILVVPRASGQAALSGVIANHNGVAGVDVEPLLPVVAQVTAVDSEASGNAFGFVATAGGAMEIASLSLRNVTASNNTLDGLLTEQLGGGTAQLTIGQSLVAGNATGADHATHGGTISSYGDNEFNDNGANVNGALTPISGM